MSHKLRPGLLRRWVDHKRRQRDMAVAQAMRAQADVSRAHADELERRQQVDGLRAQWRHAVGPKVDPGQLEQLQHALEVGHEIVSQAHTQVDVRLAALQAARDVARQAMQQLEAVEKLAQAQRDAALRETIKTEQRQLDDFVRRPTRELT